MTRIRGGVAGDQPRSAARGPERRRSRGHGQNRAGPGAPSLRFLRMV